MHDFYTIAACI